MRSHPSFVALVIAACTSGGSGSRAGAENEPAGPPTIVELDAGNFHTCVRQSDGTVECWGQCGYQCGARAEGSTARLPVAGLAGAVELAVGDSHACARLEDGQVSCWGSNYGSGLGRPSPDASPVPLVVPDLRDVVEIDIGGDLTCARAQDGRVTCWGRSSGDYENGAEATARRMPARVEGVTGALALAVASNRACARTAEAHRWSCWSWGVGADYVPRMEAAVHDARLDGIADFTDGTCTCTRTSAGVIHCIGTGILSARLADGSSPPVQLHECPADGLTGVAQMLERCAIMDDRSVRCWGGLVASTAGGRPIWYDNAKPMPIPGVTDVVALAVGANHACALSDGNALACWGSNGQGQIDGTPSDTGVWPPRRVE